MKIKIRKSNILIILYKYVDIENIFTRQAQHTVRLHAPKETLDFRRFFCFYFHSGILFLCAYFDRV
jgi:hypothetical protein